MIVVHVTHEAVEKIGGIGAVISGLMTADAYRENVSRTILLGPLFSTEGPANRRLGEGGQVIYSSVDGLMPPPWREKFRAIERTYDVGIIYGRRKVNDACTGREVEAEVILLEVFHANAQRLNLFKAELWKKFAIESSQFENTWEYEEYVRLAEPGFEALKAIGADGADEQVVLLGHEYMGMPLNLKAILAGPQKFRTVFYAHEVASVRPIVEEEPGHDTMFYNVMQAGQDQDKTLEEIFPGVFSNYKHGLVKAGRYCDHVFAVGDFVTSEMKFIDRHFQNSEIDLVYNGIPADRISLEERTASRERMRQYAENLTGNRPTWIFTHVARPVRSKALWRDLRVMHELEPMLAERDESAVLFLLATMAGQRRPTDVRTMERVYGWPVYHERGYPDLCQGEEELGEMFMHYNQDHHATRAIFVNQWDWSPQFCGQRMPEDMTFPDIRRGTDVEFGLSIYEPYGISQFEPLSYGAICAVSNVCGCMGFANRVMAGQQYDNILEGNFLHLPKPMPLDELLEMTGQQRDDVESLECRRLARELRRRLPDDDPAREKLMADGHRLARQMSWEHVVNDYFMPALDRVSRKS